MPKSQSYGGRLTKTRNCTGLVLYLAGGWRSYREIGEEFGWKVTVKSVNNIACRTARRNVLALEQAGLPVEWTDTLPRRMRLPPDWVARTPWLRRYIVIKEELKK